MTDNLTTELLDGLRHVGNLHEFAELFGFDWYDDSDWTWHDVAVKMADDFEQAIAATLGGNVKDCENLLWEFIGALDVADTTDADKKPIVSDYARHIAATLGSENCARCAEDMGRYADSLCDPLKERIAELLRCLENDWNIRASWDGLRRFWCIELTEEGVRMRDVAHGTLTAEQVRKAAKSNSRKYKSPVDDGIWMKEYDWQAIADELNELGNERIKRLEKLIRAMYLDLLAEMPESMLEDRLIQMGELGIEVYGDDD